MLHTDCTFFLFYSFFKWIQRRQKINVKKVYLFTFILRTGLNSHATGKNPHFSFCWNATFSYLSLTEMCWMTDNFDNVRCQFSQLSIFQSVIIFLRNKNLNYLSLNYLEKISQAVFKHTAILIFVVLTVFAIMKSVDYQNFLKT